MTERIVERSEHKNKEEMSKKKGEGSGEEALRRGFNEQARIEVETRKTKWGNGEKAVSDSKR